MPSKGVKRWYECGVPRKIAEDYHHLAAQKNIEWIGVNIPANIASPTLWRCLKGHSWRSPYRNVHKNKYPCPVCSKRIGAYKLEARHYRALAERQELTWIGSLPPGGHEETTWRCKHGHVFESSYHSTRRRKSSCPVCFRMIRDCRPPTTDTTPRTPEFVNGRAISTNQRYIHRLIGGELNYTLSPYSLDVAIIHDGKRIDIEYDEQYWHSNTLKRELARDNFLLRNGWFIVRIRANNQLPTKQQLMTAISRLTDDNRYQEICLNCVE